MSWTMRGVLAVQVAFFAIWGRSLLTAYEPGSGPPGRVATVWLATEPVDPRDLLAGNFVALRYAMTDPAKAGCATPLAPGTVYVALATSGKKVATAEGKVELSEAAGCRSDAPPDDDGRTWITARRDQAPGHDRLVYGIERMYVSETSPLRNARSGDVVAKVAVNESFAPRILALVPTKADGAAAH